MPFVRHIYSASKQISAAISPDQNTQAFKEVAIIRHPRIGEYAFGFITSSVVLQVWNDFYVAKLSLPHIVIPERRSYAVSMFPPTIFTLVIYSLLTARMMLIHFVCSFELQKLSCPVACQCPRSCRQWIQGLRRWIEVGPKEDEKKDILDFR
ncbi:Protein like COV 1 [Vitis vinifera]|uniref:Protein like COV 1 n=1 Tax=Vitis vinifera TaxID=29760 RepID=A0A438DS84_VITVI|nr:Protein like COV 1 [Vitis vinifera]RVW96308.1 Protein like COV 1 [Vitis vinifera]